MRPAPRSVTRAGARRRRGGEGEHLRVRTPRQNDDDVCVVLIEGEKDWGWVFKECFACVPKINGVLRPRQTSEREGEARAARARERRKNARTRAPPPHAPRLPPKVRGQQKHPAMQLIDFFQHEAQEKSTPSRSARSLWWGRQSTFIIITTHACTARCAHAQKKLPLFFQKTPLKGNVRACVVEEWRRRRAKSSLSSSPSRPSAALCQIRVIVVAAAPPLRPPSVCCGFAVAVAVAVVAAAALGRY